MLDHAKNVGLSCGVDVHCHHGTADLQRDDVGVGQWRKGDRATRDRRSGQCLDPPPNRGHIFLWDTKLAVSIGSEVELSGRSILVEVAVQGPPTERSLHAESSPVGTNLGQMTYVNSPGRGCEGVPSPLKSAS